MQNMAISRCCFVKNGKDVSKDQIITRTRTAIVIVTVVLDMRLAYLTP